jgi:hypothetical protein
VGAYQVGILSLIESVTSRLDGEELARVVGSGSSRVGPSLPVYQYIRT